MKKYKICILRRWYLVIYIINLCTHFIYTYIVKISVTLFVSILYFYFTHNTSIRYSLFGHIIKFSAKKGYELTVKNCINDSLSIPRLEACHVSLFNLYELDYWTVGKWRYVRISRWPALLPRNATNFFLPFPFSLYT